MYSSTVTDFWFGPHASAPDAAGTRVVVDPALPENRRLSILELDGASGILSLTPELAAKAGVDAGSTLDPAGTAGAVERAGVTLNGADDIFYFSVDEQRDLREEEVPASIRQLTAADSELFEAFTSAAPEDDLDEAFVELDHWLVYGAFVDGELACASSMYPWSGSTLADLGVITLPEFRGRGLARRTVRAIGAHALGLGHEPQYRCQLDNAASIAVARSAGMSLFATWDVVSED